MGGLQKIVILALFVFVAYWLYEPVPVGFSMASSIHLQMFFAKAKIGNTLIVPLASALGFGSRANITRYLHRLSGGDMTPDPEVRTEDANFDGVPVRIFTPIGMEGKGDLSGFVFYHGGGWVTGDIDSYHSLVLLLCKETKAVFVSVNYRLAPEYVFPAAFQDATAATKYFFKHAQQYHVDQHRLAVGGDSAGGNLAAAVAQKLRDDNFEPSPKMQVLIYPALQFLDLGLPSMFQNAHGPLLTHEITVYFKSMYIDGGITERSALYRTGDYVSPIVKKQMAATFLNVDRLPKKYLVGYERPSLYTGNDAAWNQIKDKMLNPYLAPLLATDVSHLPMTYMFTCEYDLLRDEGFLYVHRLKETGNNVTHIHADNGFHGIISFTPKIPEARALLDGVVDYIVKNL